MLCIKSARPFGSDEQGFELHEVDIGNTTAN